MLGDGVAGDRDRVIGCLTALRDDPPAMARRARAGLSALSRYQGTGFMASLIPTRSRGPCPESPTIRSPTVGHSLPPVTSSPRSSPPRERHAGREVKGRQVEVISAERVRTASGPPDCGVRLAGGGRDLHLTGLAVLPRCGQVGRRTLAGPGPNGARCHRDPGFPRPALIAILGRWNWWISRPLRRTLFLAGTYTPAEQPAALTQSEA
jgi:hypothetical protein